MKAVVFQEAGWVLLADVYYVLRELTDQKVCPFEVGQEVVKAFDLNAQDFVGASSRRDILHTQPRQVTGSGSATKSIGDVPFYVLL
ncbi:hypothetical protein HU758_020000 [Pseudomonas sp. RW1P2]|uniref:Uncharacterized protein n=1 Tax=Pseudomonas kurunegalensis TaxID=485880 RepID=A0ACC5USL9_9PSED|nr:hypothetical protein [Pseudomonas monteilii]MBV4517456.1 hypothetical protein [Pseudomonas kurunegalensis]MBZ3666428.1 hypothetical protein [Pseudomonas monteilii]MBZ3671772.1 hypothetical protein [Pseudomonas monteilii]BBV99870.1 hypothetical protein STW0522PSE72_52210 [Pseudomonas monteilii]